MCWFKASFRIDRISRSTTKNTEFCKIVVFLEKMLAQKCLSHGKLSWYYHIHHQKRFYKYLINKLEFSDDD